MEEIRMMVSNKFKYMYTYIGKNICIVKPSFPTRSLILKMMSFQLHNSSLFFEQTQHIDIRWQ